ncbi:CAAX prenyl protease [Ascoidea rubescens DSM 1968]|uniref:intramembrane prenyl-peptidase Rce1 n=1 Tax=Ascoidea rubescens DSM 1968 TaxID=1344418 RepID=A0A1D2VQ73_9ASCO|nr:Abi-domain-containing protein [Ascoidea rubescens DSM 1968]ODV63734.1 Abi-domain-containing protein [Ascoidea rubescens DSM 1968]
MRIKYTTTFAYCLSFLIAVSYVLVLYVVPRSRVAAGEPPATRNDPIAVRTRIKKVLILSLFWIAALPVILTYFKVVHNIVHGISVLGIIPGLKYTHDAFIFRIDYVFVFMNNTAKSLLLVVILFAGPLFDYVVLQKNQFGRRTNIIRNFYLETRNIWGFRNVIVGPFTEEIVYTSCILGCLYPLNKIGLDVLIFVTPLYFGVAHLHHGYELYSTSTYKKLFIVKVCLAQFAYTSLFGIFTNYVFLRMGNVWSCFVVHSFCNYMGFPSFKPSSNRTSMKTVYYLLLIGGAIGFFMFLKPLTHSKLSPIKWH